METKKRIALITGGTRGIGLGCAEQLARAGLDLAVNGTRSQDKVAATLDRLRSFGSNVIYCRGNIAADAQRRKVMSKVSKRFGRLHVLVNNAGIAPRQRRDILESTEKSFDEVLGINLKGPYFLSQAAAKWMIEQSVDGAQLEGFRSYRGYIINISSAKPAM